MLHIPPTKLLLLAAKQEPYKKSLSLNQKYWRIFWKRFRRKGQQADKDKTERVTGLGRRTREEIAKWNQMTALRSQTGGGGGVIGHPRPPFGHTQRSLHCPKRSIQTGQARSVRPKNAGQRPRFTVKYCRRTAEHYIQLPWEADFDLSVWQCLCVWWE